MQAVTFICPNCHKNTSTEYERCQWCHWPISLDAREAYQKTGKFRQSVAIQRNLATPTVKLNLDEYQTMPVTEDVAVQVAEKLDATVIIHSFIEARQIVKQLVKAGQITVWMIKALGHDAWFSGNEALGVFSAFCEGDSYENEPSANHCVVAVTRKHREIVIWQWQLESTV